MDIRNRQIARKLETIFKGIDKGIENDESKFSKYLAAYIIYYLAECELEEALEAVVDGADDNGIDALIYSKHLQKLIMVQSKFSKQGNGEPESAGVLKFSKGIKDLLNEKYELFNKKINNKIPMIKEALDEFGVKYECILVDTYNTVNLSKHSTEIMDSLIKEIDNNPQESLIKFKRYGQNEIYDLLAKNLTEENIDITITLENWGLMEEDETVAYYGSVTGVIVSDLWINYKNNLFSKNIRQGLGKTEINKEILETIATEPDKFWYYNNGITIVCNKIEKNKKGGTSRKNGTFRLEGASVINGAQTISTIGEAIENGSCSDIDLIKVHARIIEAKDDQFKNKITRNNNRQNKIENIDFLSQEEEQIRLKNELAVDDVIYSINRSGSFKASEREFNIEEATIALACGSKELDVVVQAKRGIGKFFEDGSKFYRKLFNRGTKGIYVYNCVILVREIEKILKAQITKEKIRSGTRYGIMTHLNRLIENYILNKLNLSEEINIVEVDEILTEKLRAQILDLIEIIEIKIKKDYKDSPLALLAKNTTKSKEVMDEVKKITLQNKGK